MIMPRPTEAQQNWTNAWLTAVADGGAKMSSRNLRSIEVKGGGIKAVAAAAKKKRLHLVLLEDDKGNQLVAASTKPFKVLA